MFQFNATLIGYISNTELVLATDYFYHRVLMYFYLSKAKNVSTSLLFHHKLKAGSQHLVFLCLTGLLLPKP